MCLTQNKSLNNCVNNYEKPKQQDIGVLHKKIVTFKNKTHNKIEKEKAKTNF